MQKRFLFVFFVVLILLFSSAQAKPLHFGILPVIDTLPLQVAIAEGYFKENKLDVKLVPFTSAMERNTAVHSGQLDGHFGDLIATLLLVDKGVQLKIMTISYATNRNQRMFGLATSPKLQLPKEVLGIAISKASIIEYLLSHIKDLPGAKSYAYDPIEIKRMPIRLQLLLAGKIDSALLPEPLLTLAESRGAQVLATDQGLKMPLTVLNISGDQKHQIKPFLAAYTRAVKRLNSHPELYRELMAKTCRIPKPLVKSFPMFTYPEPRIPTKKEVSQVQDWMIQKGLLKQTVLYQKLVL